MLKFIKICLDRKTIYFISGSIWGWWYIMTHNHTSTMHEFATCFLYLTIIEISTDKMK